MTWGVGIIGSGPGVAALHAPTLARTDGDFRLVHVSDAGSGRAAVIAERFGARASSGVDALFADPDVDVVAVCSPPSLHAQHVRASLAAGRRAISARSPRRHRRRGRPSRRRVRRGRRAAGRGHEPLFDPAWTRATHHLSALDGRISAVTVTLCLSPNDRYHALTMGEPLPAGRPCAAHLSTSTIPSRARRSCVSSWPGSGCTICRSCAISYRLCPTWCGPGRWRPWGSIWRYVRTALSCASRP